MYLLYSIGSRFVVFSTFWRFSVHFDPSGASFKLFSTFLILFLHFFFIFWLYPDILAVFKWFSLHNARSCFSPHLTKSGFIADILFPFVFSTFSPCWDLFDIILSSSPPPPRRWRTWERSASWKLLWFTPGECIRRVEMLSWRAFPFCTWHSRPSLVSRSALSSCSWTLNVNLPTP